MTRFWLLLFLTVLTLALPAHAQEEDAPPLKTGSLATLPVLHEGRIKPLDTFARTALTQIAGKDHLKDQSAMDWLAETLFDPARATQQAVFRVESAPLRHRLGLPDRKRPLYSFLELTDGLKATAQEAGQLAEKPRKDLGKDQRALLDLHEAALTYTQILRALSLTLPLAASLPPDLAKKADLKEGERPSWLALKKIEKELEAETRAIIKTKGENLETYTNQERGLAALAWQVQVIAAAAEGNALLRILPPTWKTDDDWKAPWDLVMSGQGSPETAALLKEWQALAIAWQERDENRWNDTLKTINETLDRLAPNVNRTKLILEKQMNRFSPLTISTAFYALTFCLTLAFILFAAPSLRTFGVFGLATGSGVHLIAVIGRVVLLDRPPVGTLYESIVFVGLICALVGLLIERKNGGGTGLLIGSLSGVFLGTLAQSLLDSGDSLQMLSAVLNTQFWLATHVLCITAGYGWCVVTAVLAHLVLLRRILPARDTVPLPDTTPLLKNLALTALLFTAVGTILGGVWADQSWGRFWGWDPKENGALLIVLWLVWLIHGRLTGTLSAPLYTAGLAALNIMVAVAWIGVNLLGVGLHSYGFTEGLFWGLGLFSAGELGLIGTLLWLGIRKDRRDAR